MIILAHIRARSNCHDPSASAPSRLTAFLAPPRATPQRFITCARDSACVHPFTRCQRVRNLLFRLVISALQTKQWATSKCKSNSNMDGDNPADRSVAQVAVSPFSSYFRRFYRRTRRRVLVLSYSVSASITLTYFRGEQSSWIHKLCELMKRVK